MRTTTPKPPHIAALISRSIALLRGMAIGALLSGTAGLAVAVPARAAPIACGGSDLLAAMRTDDPAHFARLEKAARAVPNGKGLLWRIEGAEKPSYLFGTIHFTDTRVHDFPPAVTKALAAVDAGAVETLAVLGDPLDPAGLEKAGMKPLLPAGETLDTLLTEREAAIVKRALSHRMMSYEIFKLQKPWILTQVLSYPPCELASLVTQNPIVDKDIALRIKQAGKPLHGLETAAEQFNSLDGVPIRTQAVLLRMAAEESGRIDDLHETFLRLYRAGDIGMLDALSRDMADEEEETEAYRVFMTHLLDRRNRRMTERALPLLKKGGVFIAVGALHLPGKDGLVALIRKEGFTVTPVAD